MNWKLYLDKTKDWLKPNGVNIILCPNYSFPYESHFKIPIILNKKITHFFLKIKIEINLKRKKISGVVELIKFYKNEKSKKLL